MVLNVFFKEVKMKYNLTRVIQFAQGVPERTTQKEYNVNSMLP